MKSAIVAALLLLTACGRVGATLPPIIRVPQKVDNLSVAQNGYSLVLSWTNPAKYIDGNPATDAGKVHVFRNNMDIAIVDVTGAGKAQSFVLPDVKSSVGVALTFTVQLEVPKANKRSVVSNVASIQPVDVPGSPRNPVATVDLGKIALTWDPPDLNPGLVEAYVVQRSDKPAPVRLTVPRFDDTDYEPGKTYSYTITAVRGTSPQIPGEGSRMLSVVAKDSTPPHIPTGLQIQTIGKGVFIQWEMNTEPDFKTYRLFRSDRAEAIYTGNANGYPDSDYESGKDISYSVLAEDVSGNPSMKSPPKPGP